MASVFYITNEMQRI